MRRTFWVCHRSSSLQFSVSHLSSDSTWGCFIPVKKAQVASPIEWALDNSLLCCKQTNTCHRISDAWPHIPCVLKRSHSRGILTLAIGFLRITRIHALCQLRRHTDTCRGIATYIAHPLSVPTQEAYWYLPWHCYWFFLWTHSRPHSSGVFVSCMAFLSNFHSCSQCYLFRP